MDSSVVTLGRFIIDQERQRPTATGAFSNILSDLTLAAKLINRAVNQAGLVDILGGTGRQNVQGEQVKKLDDYAQEVVYRAMDHGGHLCGMLSEEVADVIPIPERFPVGDYVLLFDPLDGSSNIDANVSIGTIFSVRRRRSRGVRNAQPEDFLRPGTEQLAAGYVLYGSSTMLVYTTGDGVHAFTLDPSIGEFLLSDESVRIPEKSRRIYSVNEGNFGKWSEGQQRFVRRLRGDGDRPDDPFTMRYIGSLVADFHRTLQYGGIFMYPSDESSPDGKLRLLYEAAPLAMLCEQAGGLATDGSRNILEIEPEELHQRTPLYIGSREFVCAAHEELGAELPEPALAG